MFGTIRRHQTWLWAIIITLTVISFVVFFSPYQKMSKGVTGKITFGSIAGKPISQEEFRDAEAEVYLHYFLTRGEWPDKDPEAKRMGFNVQRETYFRLLLTAKQKELGIEVSGAAVAELGQNILRSFERAGVTSLETFERGILAPHNLNATDFERFLRHEASTQQLIPVIGMSGKLVTPQEAETLYRREHEEAATEAVFFPATNFLSAVSATPETITQFYAFSTNEPRLPDGRTQASRYRVPDRVQVSYVKYDVTNYLAEADLEIAKITNFNQQVDAAYEKRGGTNYYKEAKSPAEAKEKMKEEERRNIARRNARTKAVEFADVLDQGPHAAESLERLAVTNGLTVKVTAPFGQEEGPQDLNVQQDFIQRAFKLTAEEPFAGPILAEDVVYVIALKKRLPSEILALDIIRERVTADYKFTEAVQLARKAGQGFYVALTNGLAQGKTFAEVCDQAKAKSLTLPLLSLSTRSLPEVEDRISVGQLQGIVSTVPTGKTSNFVPTGDGGLIVHVKSRFPVGDEKLKKELPNFLAYVRQTRQNEAFNNWFRKQAEQGLRDTPLMRQRGPAQPEQ